MRSLLGHAPTVAGRTASVPPWVDRRRELYSVRYREGGESKDA